LASISSAGFSGFTGCRPRDSLQQGPAPVAAADQSSREAAIRGQDFAATPACFSAVEGIDRLQDVQLADRSRGQHGQLHPERLVEAVGFDDDYNTECPLHKSSETNLTPTASHIVRTAAARSEGALTIPAAAFWL
jgi:hypothetical protein